MEHVKTTGLWTQPITLHVASMLSFGVYAASSVIDVPFQEYTSRQIASLLFLITIGGLSGLMHRLMKEYRRHGKLDYPKVFVLSNLTGAVAAGVLAVFVGEGAGMAPWGKGILVLGFSAGGSMLVEVAWRSLARHWFPSDGGKNQKEYTE